MIEDQLKQLTEAIVSLEASIREVLTAGAVTPTNVTPITGTPKPAAAPKGKAKAAAPAVVVTEPETPVEAEERPTKVAVETPKETEFSDPLDNKTVVVVQGSAPAPTPDEIIVQITDTWKSLLTAADADRKNMLKDKFPELRAKWGLAEGAKLATLSDRPENLTGLLEDIKAL